MLWTLLFTWLSFASPTALPDLRGELTVLTPGKQGTVLLFLSASCPCTNGATAELRKLARDHKDFRFYGLNVDYGYENKDLREFYQKAKLGFPIVRDEGLAVAKQYGIELMAESVVLSPEGKVLYQGGIKTEKDEALLQNALAEIHSGKTVSVARGKGVGCLLRYPSKN